MPTFNVSIHVFQLHVLWNFLNFLIFLSYISTVFQAAVTESWVFKISVSSTSLCYWKLEHAVSVHLLIPTQIGSQHFCWNCIYVVHVFSSYLLMLFLCFEILLLYQRKVNVSKGCEDLET